MLFLAQRLGLVEAPPSQLTESEWQGVKDKAKLRHDFQQPCVICKDDLGLKYHVSHIVHLNTPLLSFKNRVLLGREYSKF